ncbi:sulfoacetaldehyde acetyltransferase [Achromobacter denitrificans]|uniref:Sulfoacetaldehyde acetyltransferase n=1 Tax=Achromobacter denitrificans TaxID=32002 RepID=A0A427WQ66_ACHDE|nr:MULTISPECIES: sulfoacetaldehyde acetyltransferase [Achromobacter]ASC68013.1 sulfoacetaldehyde acetyltransferase [Achromobacter denitrificans]MBV2158368.1 sulfoacetaldehyde acetyltransferase [Achromobacter denitrificans]MDF3858058.1 sulfoacetaldehyde acetyltransferase [Achromobacter denitrificans]MDX3882013.1 sulfoacetaldehyde acetyltransferase [Achromobacter sp.]MPT38345.1 sulfoacetaldehyde acetyltransferase [Achromobacter sp.]
MSSKQHMTPSEAFVETLVAQGVKDVFGIVGSAFMDALDLFPAAGIRFVPTVHEQGAAHMADGYSRVTGRHGVCIAQNGPGITNFVTGVAAAYWAHSPVVAITPETGTSGMGLGGFQETEQLPIFSRITKYQAHVNRPDRMAEFTAKAFDNALAERGPTQLNIPRDYFYGEVDVAIPEPRRVRRGPGSEEDLEAAAAMLAQAKFPVIVAGGGVLFSEGQAECVALAELLGAPVVTSYLHNDAFPASHPLWCGPLGYQGAKAGMKLLSQADVVLALGTRLGPFGTLPQHGLDYWPQGARIIQVDADHRMLGLVRPVSVGICGDAKPAAAALTAKLKGRDVASARTKAARGEQIAAQKAEWEKELDSWSHERDDWSLDIIERGGGRMHPRRMLRELELAMPKHVMVSTDIGNICSVSNSYLRFDEPNSMLAAMSFGNCGYALPALIGAKLGRPDRPAVAYVGDGAWCMSFQELLTCVREQIPVTAVVFHNGQWGAEKKNQVDFYGRRFVGSNLKNPNFSELARAMGAEGIRVEHADQVGAALQAACKAQSEGKTTVLEMMVSQELGDPFRRDALKQPVRFLDKYKPYVNQPFSPGEVPLPIDPVGR